MRKKTLFLIFMAMVVGGLLCSASDTMAFHAPIQGDDVLWDLDCSHSDYCTLTLEANDPIRGTVSQGYLIWTDYAYEGNFHFIQDDGVIVWYYIQDEYPTDTYRWGINYAVYDPGSGEWKAGGPHVISIEQEWPALAVLDQNNGNNDGVVVWYYVSGESGYYTKDWRIEYAIYDPVNGAWEQTYHSISLYNGSLVDVDNNAGVVAWYYYTAFGSTKWYYDQTIYDPQTGAWESVMPTYFDPAAGAVTLTITDDATVEYTYSGTTHIVGYDYEKGWRATRTKPFSYFVASPTSGDQPLFVWFTDMSIGATSWDWDFGDSGTSGERSPSHTFIYSDVFTVTQTVDDSPEDPEHFSTQQISVGPFYTLTVTKTGAGTGTVTSDPAGIVCGTTCEAAEAAFPVDTEVTLTADPEENSIFTGWSGSGCSGTGPCEITMDSDKTVTATFDRATAILHKDGAIWSADTGWNTATPPNYPGTAYAVDIEYREDGSYVILHKEGAIYDSAVGWNQNTPPYYPGTVYARDLEIKPTDSSYTILHKDGALWNSASGWVMTTPPYYEGTAYAVDLEYRSNGSYLILHKEGSVYDSDSGWITTTPPYYPGNEWAKDLELKSNGAHYVILHKDGALWSSDGGWMTDSPPYTPGTAYAVDLELKADGTNYIILHKKGARYDSESGWNLDPPYNENLEWAVDLEFK